MVGDEVKVGRMCEFYFDVSLYFDCCIFWIIYFVNYYFCYVIHFSFFFLVFLFFLF